MGSLKTRHWLSDISLHIQSDLMMISILSQNAWMKIESKVDADQNNEICIQKRIKQSVKRKKNCFPPLFQKAFLKKKIKNCFDIVKR